MVALPPTGQSPRPASTAPALSGVSVLRGGRPALTDVTLDFDPGSITALVGPNGSGKTTLLEVVAGLRSPTSGRVTAASSVAMVTQNHGRGWLPLTVREVVAMARFTAGRPRRFTDADHRAVDAAMERLEVTDLARHQFSGLSGGHQQRASIAQAVARDAETLLLDEPVTGLDLASQEVILGVMDEERSAGRVIVVSTHNLDEARHADRVVVLAGRLVAQGPPDAVLCPDVLRAAYGERLLGDHGEHDHRHELLLIDDHGHGSHG